VFFDTLFVANSGFFFLFRRPVPEQVFFYLQNHDRAYGLVCFFLQTGFSRIPGKRPGTGVFAGKWP